MDPVEEPSDEQYIESELGAISLWVHRDGTYYWGINSCLRDESISFELPDRAYTTNQLMDLQDRCKRHIHDLVWAWNTGGDMTPARDAIAQQCATCKSTLRFVPIKDYVACRTVDMVLSIYREGPEAVAYRLFKDAQHQGIYLLGLGSWAADLAEQIEEFKTEH